MSKWWWPFNKKESSPAPIQETKTEAIEGWLDSWSFNGAVPRGTFAFIARQVGCRHSLVSAVAKRRGIRSLPHSDWDVEEDDALDAA